MRFPRGGLLVPLFLPLILRAAKVEKVFESNCVSCHGPGGSGGLATALDDGVWRCGSTDDDIARVIRDGIPESGMPGWGGSMKPEQIRAMVVYLRELEASSSRRRNPVAVPKPEAVVRTQLCDFRITKLADLPGTPWSLAFLPDGRMPVTLKDGRMLLLPAKAGAPVESVDGLPRVLEIGQGGLMDVAVPSNHAETGLIYLTLTEPDDSGKKGMTVLVRGRLRGTRWSDTETLWRAEPRWYTSNGVHFGSRIAFDGKGAVYFTVGERGRNHDEGAQSLVSPYGKVFRIPEKGLAKPEEEWSERSVSAAEAERRSCTSCYDTVFRRSAPGLWSYGHRNQQGLAFEPATGDLYATEHGPRGGDELNRIQPGKNYGWPLVTHGMNYDGTPWGNGETSRPGLEPPVVHWTPSLAVCGLAFCRGEAFPDWRGDLFTGALAGSEIRRLRIRDRRVVGQETILRGLGRVRDVRCGPDGRIYALLNGPGRLIRLDPVKRPEAASH